MRKRSRRGGTAMIRRSTPSSASSRRARGCVPTFLVGLSPDARYDPRVSTRRNGNVKSRRTGVSH